MLEHLPPAVGRAMQPHRAGLDETLARRLGHDLVLEAIEVSSPAFDEGAAIPARHSADGEGLSPPLQWSGVPAGASEVVVLVEDADAPTPHPLVHAIVAGLAGSDGALAEGAIAKHMDEEEGGAEAGRNSYWRRGWLPPDPPPGHGPHRYAFQVFVLGPGRALPHKPWRVDVEWAVRERGIACGCVIGTYERPDETTSH